MAKEYSAGAVIFRKDPMGTQYLLLHYPSGSKTKKEYWDFAKGHLEAGETELVTALREVFEETGLRNVRIVPDFREVIQYYFKAEGRTVFKTVVFYLGETKEKTIRISSEHQGFLWLPFKEAMKYLKFANAKKILTKTHAFLQGQSVRSGKNHS
ncbi:MAG: NUDIX domain-containing protein [bacterium]|nr:NUDIX domain-containing protein [bacterium]